MVDEDILLEDNEDVCAEVSEDVLYEGGRKFGVEMDKDSRFILNEQCRDV